MNTYYFIRYHHELESGEKYQHEILAEVATYSLLEAARLFVNNKRLLIDILDYCATYESDDDYLFEFNYKYGMPDIENPKQVTKFVKYMINKYGNHGDLFLEDIRESNDRENRNNFDIIDKNDRTLKIVRFNKENIRIIIDVNILKEIMKEYEIIPDIVDIIHSYMS